MIVQTVTPNTSYDFAADVRSAARRAPFWHGSLLLSGLLVLLQPQLVGGIERAGQHVLIGFGEPDVGASHPAPTARNRQKDLRLLGDKGLLMLNGQHQVPVAVRHRCQRGKDPPAHAKIHRAHVRAFLRAGKLRAMRRKSSDVIAEALLTFCRPL